MKRDSEKRTKKVKRADMNNFFMKVPKKVSE